MRSVNPMEWYIRFVDRETSLDPNNPPAAIITAMPFFLSRLAGSHLKTVFSSYLVASMQLSRLPTLVHATYSVKRVSHIPGI